MSAPSAVPAKQSRHTFSWLLLITANVLWAASYVAAKFALQDTSVNVMLALRMGISALVLLPFLIARRKQFKLTRESVPQLLILTLVGFVINKLLEYGGLVFMYGHHISLLIPRQFAFSPCSSL